MTSNEVVSSVPSIQHLRTTGVVLKVEGKRLVDGIDLALEPHSLSMIMGPNGAGKSLFLRLIHGLLEPTSGRILWGGRPMTREIRMRQALVFQRPVLLRRSVGANLDFVLGLRGAKSRKRRDMLLERVGLGARQDQPARLLSGGEQQRLALARALVLEPEILLLDEPTANLDPASVLMIEEIIREVHEAGAKIIFVTHDLAQARRLGGEIIFMHSGKVLEQTPVREFFDKPRSSSGRDFLAGRIIT